MDNSLEKWAFDDEYFDLWVLFDQTRDAIYVARRKELERYGITVGEAGVLLQTNRLGDKAIPAEIARWVFRKPHTIGSKLMRMERKGLLLRTKDLGKKNLIRISLTEKGLQRLNDCMARESVHHVLSTLSRDERSLLKSMLLKLRSEALKWAESTGEEIELPPTQ